MIDRSQLSTDQLIDRFERCAVEQGDAFDYSLITRVNRLIDELVELEAELKRREPDQRSALIPLLTHKHVNVRFRSALALLAVATEEAREALQNIVALKRYPQTADAIRMLRSLDEGRYVPN